MKKLSILLLLAGVFLEGCSPKVVSNVNKNYQALEASAEVVVLGEDAQVPADAELIGQLKVGDTGFTINNGSYEDVVALAKEKARQAGGNILKITEHKAPDGFFSTIHRIKADIFRVDDIRALAQEQRQVEESMNPAHPDYAVIYFYREAGVAPLVTYDVHIGEEKVYRSKSGSGAEVKIYDAGEVMIWAKTESKEILPLDIKLGGEYYVRCSVTTGLLVGRPAFEKVSPSSGKVEYESARK